MDRNILVCLFVDMFGESFLFLDGEKIKVKVKNISFFHFHFHFSFFIFYFSFFIFIFIFIFIFVSWRKNMNCQDDLFVLFSIRKT